MTNRPATRLYMPDRLAEGATVLLDAAQAHRLRDVLRLKPGAAIAVFNARDGEWLCRLSGPDLAVERCLRAPQPEGDLWLLFAPLRRGRLDWLVEKASELGVAALVPVLTARTQPQPFNRERLAALAVAAAEQSERLSVPEIRDPAPLDQVLRAWPAARRIVMCDESGQGMPIAA
ncbi:MAG TPA: RsmE family RNA methyltransferase, partial [Stellaceae bacterium]|nr:RsmE family RNA methyltransferase [Stellaceae bacterium]